MKIGACLSRKTDDWKTPSEIYKIFMNNGYIDCFKYQSEENELMNDYENEKLFINPPFSKMKQINNWLIKQCKKNKVALLIPSRTDTQYFHELIKLKPIIYFIKGRLHYNDSGTAPFPTILMIFNKNKESYYYGISQNDIHQII